MNISELARQLKTSTKELREALPELGFDIGARAIKVDDVIAHKIIEKWSHYKKGLIIKQKMAEQLEKEKLQPNETEEKELKTIKIPNTIIVRDFAQKLNLTVTQVVQELMKNGILAALNERIDYETATIIAEDLGFKIELEKGEDSEKLSTERLEELLKEDKSKLKPRPPVIVIMGHIDHGKTKLLDYIRKTNVTEKEAGGITQHIGAYQIKNKEKVITFIDTPGHEAFTTMRSRGARVADIAILVIAADDGIKPQTEEAIKIIQGAKLPMVVAINKIDKPEANIEKVKQELAQHNLIPEDWGGKTICAPISAKEGTGVDDMLDVLLLVADMEKENIRANPKRPAIGTVIESNVDKGEGLVATVLIQAGTLKNNDILGINQKLYGKVRVMKNFRDEIIKEAGPATPVKILGLKAAPHVGDILEVAPDIKSLKKKYKSYETTKDKFTETITKPKKKSGEGEEKTFNLIIKADVLGSLETIILSLERFSQPDVKINIISKGLGNISGADILRAEASRAMVACFHVQPSSEAAELAREKKITIKEYKVIYNLLDDVKIGIEKLLDPEITKTILGTIQVLAVFKKEKNDMIIGGKVIGGKIEKASKARVLRKGVEITKGEITDLQIAKESVNEVDQGQECGIKFRGDQIIEANDVLEVYREDKKEKKLE